MVSSMSESEVVHIVGAGLAGSEAAWQIASSGLRVVLHEMRPIRRSAAHQTDELAELVCSNSFRSDDAEVSAVGLLHAEMRRLGSLIMSCADANQVPAGSALAVDRDGFSSSVTRRIRSHPLITLVRGEITEIPSSSWDNVIIATGPLTSDALVSCISDLVGEKELAFFDSMSPILHYDSICKETVWKQSRYDRSGSTGSAGADYINCPLSNEEYYDFVDALLAGDKVLPPAWEGVPYFEGCLPIEIMAQRGKETLRHGPMKPFGLTNPKDPTRKPYAVVQLRQDNLSGTLWNMVGFQTQLKHKEQVRIFRMIPGLENAVFARLGGMHRNTYINSPKLLDRKLRLKADPRLRFAGQIAGCEGYAESAAIGLLAGLFAVGDKRGVSVSLPPVSSALGALLNYITVGHVLDKGEKSSRSFQPMNVNFGLFPGLEERVDHFDAASRRRPLRGRDKHRLITRRALMDLEAWISAR